VPDAVVPDDPTHESASTTTSTASTSPPASGVLAGRYEVTALIGRGGMGDVFRARDTRLRRDVAIKVLNPELAARPAFAEHLLREARAAAQLHHPHITTVHDVVDDAGSLFIVMEYLEGETLARRLHGGPLAVDDAMAIGGDIVSALDHAHQKNIVHCDLKPGNVFLTRDAGAKVVDFGLARVLRTVLPEVTDAIGASHSLIDSRAGTLAYMSPEHRLGLPLDHRADIYSFGIVLHEMLTGQRPDSTATPITLDRPGTSPSNVERRQLDEASAIITRALAPEPSARFQSARDVKQALKAIGDRSGPRVGRSAMFWAPVGALLASVIALLLSVSWPMKSTGAGAAPPTIGVTRFASATGDESMTSLTSGLSALVAADLGASNQAVVARSDATAATAVAARALAADLGVDTLILGDVVRSGSELTITLRLYLTRRDLLTDHTIVREPGTDLRTVARALTSAVRAELAQAGVLARDAAANRLDSSAFLPSAMASLEEFEQARTFMNQRDADSVDHAITLLERIIDREPGFALAHARLGEATWRKWQTTKDPAWSGRGLNHAFEALRLSPNQPEIRFVVALIYQGTGRPKEAIAELERVAAARPLDNEVSHLLGRLYAETGRVSDGLRELQRAIDMRPAYWLNHASFGTVAYRAGEYQQALAAFQRYSDLRPDSATPHQQIGTVHQAMGNPEAALASYQRALSISPNANAYSNVGTLHFDAGRYAEAVEAYTRAVDLQPKNPSLRRNLADACLRAGQARRAADAYAQAAELADTILAVNPKDAPTLSLKAVALARTGRLAEAERLSQLAVDLVPTNNDVLFERGLILTLRGDTDNAIDALVKAVEAGYSKARLQADPDLAPLRKLAAFERLVVTP
jgi:serine/threonine-protein kinase